MKTHLLAIGREFLSNDLVGQTDLCLATELPSWKISRLFKRLELLGFIEVEKESRFVRGRPRKIGRLTPKGREYFKRLLSVRDEDDSGGRASSAREVEVHEDG